MKQIIFLVDMILLARSSSVIEVNSDTKTIKDPNEGVLQCINRVSPLVNDPALFCGDMVSKNAACYSSYYSLKLCLVNNDCQSQMDALTIPVECWNCWKDMLTGVKEFKDFQSKISVCSESKLVLGILAFVLIAMLFF